LSDIGDFYRRGGDNVTRIWKLVAYLGRYGHQPVNVVMRMTMREMGLLAEQVNEIVREENESNRGNRDD